MASTGSKGLVYGRSLVSQKTGKIVDFDDIIDTAGEPLVRRKSEVIWSGINLEILAGETLNLITLLKDLTPTTGSMEPFFRVSDNKLHCYNENASLFFKLNLIGQWASSTNNLSMRVTFVGTVGNTIYQPRTPAITTDVVSFENFFSIDKNGNIATNGTTMNVVCNGAAFTASQIMLIAEQVVPVSATQL